MHFLLILLLIPFIALAQDSDEVVVDDTVPQDTVAIELDQTIDPYTVTDVVVDVTADNAVIAREAAFKKGSEVAVQAFLEAQGASTDLRGSNPDSLVKSFKVDEENFSDTRYRARLSYKFKPRSIAMLANQSLPSDRKLPVPFDAGAQNDDLINDSLIDTPVPFDPNAPWNPDSALIQDGSAIMPDGRSVRPDTAYEPQNAPPTLNNWQLTVRYNQVPDWLMAQQLIGARPEVRGFKIATMSSNFAILNMTSTATPEQILSQWSSLGWRVVGGAGGLVLDAETMR